MKIINPDPYEKIKFDKFPNHLEFFDKYPKYYIDYFILFYICCFIVLKCFQNKKEIKNG